MWFIGPAKQILPNTGNQANTIGANANEIFKSINIEPFQSAVTELQMRKYLFKLFTGDVDANNTTYLNQLEIQTRPKYKDTDIVVKKYYFTQDPNLESQPAQPALNHLVNYITVQKRDRETDFYLNCIYGLSISILFTYNYDSNLSEAVDVDAVITEKAPQDISLDEVEKAKYKTMKFNKCQIKFNPTASDKIILTLTKLTKLDYTPPEGVTSPKSIAGNKLVEQRFDIYIHVPDLSATTTLTLTNILGLLDTNESFVEYSVNMSINESAFVNYLTWQLYITTITQSKINANVYMKTQLEKQTKTLLEDKYNKIITPMFMVDNKISQLSDSIKNVIDIYNFNKLNNMSTQLRFYNSV